MQDAAPRGRGEATIPRWQTLGGRGQEASTAWGCIISSHKRDVLASIKPGRGGVGMLLPSDFSWQNVDFSSKISSSTLMGKALSGTTRRECRYPHT